MDLQQTLTFYLEIIEEKLTGMNKEMVKMFFQSLETEFSDLFQEFEEKIKKLVSVVE